MPLAVSDTVGPPFQVSATAVTTIYARYGGTAPSALDPTQTWSSSYGMVHHFSDPTYSPYYGVLDEYITGTPITSFVSGQAYAFSGTSGSYYYNGFDIPPIILAGDVSIEAWLNVKSLPYVDLWRGAAGQLMINRGLATSPTPSPSSLLFSMRL